MTRRRREFLEWAVEAAPALATPGARLFSLAGLGRLPASVKEAHAALRAAETAPAATPSSVTAICAAKARSSGAPRRWRNRFLHRKASRHPRWHCKDVWFEIEDGPAILRGINLELHPGERVALMGRNGAGKSTLLRLAKGLAEPTRGRVERAGEVALLLQNPGDYLVHDHAVDDAGVAGVASAGLAGREAANPRDLSGGERQRLALEVVLAGEPAAVVLLDEPTRGMDRIHKDELAARTGELAEGGAAVMVATHDTEFAAVARRSHRAARPGRGDRGRLAARGARRRPPLLDRGGAGDRRGRAAARRTARACCATPARAAAARRSGARDELAASSLALLALALAAGFAWYEREKPPARVLARGGGARRACGGRPARVRGDSRT